MKEQKDGLDALPDILKHAQTGTWQEMTEDDKQRSKWFGLFFRKQTPGHFMLRVRLTCGQTNAQQFRVLADLSDDYGKGFADITTRQQIQLRWFTIGDVPDIWRRLEGVGLTSKQTGLDNIRGVCGCPVAGLNAHELFDASQAAREFNDHILDNREFTNLPRKFNVTITGCLENCCHTETQDIALVPAFRELNGQQVNGFNVLIGGKQGSGGYLPALPLNVFVRPENGAELCSHIVGIFRDYGTRTTRNRARLRHLLDDAASRGSAPNYKDAGTTRFTKRGPTLRKEHHVDHLGIHPQKPPHSHQGPQLYYAGLLVPVGRITTAQTARRRRPGGALRQRRHTVDGPAKPPHRQHSRRPPRRVHRGTAAPGVGLRSVAGDARSGGLRRQRLLSFRVDRNQGLGHRSGPGIGKARGRSQDRAADDSLVGLPGRLWIASGWHHRFARLSFSASTAKWWTRPTFTSTANPVRSRHPPTI